MSKKQDELKKYVSVTLYQNNMSKKDEYFGMIPRHSVNIMNIIADAAKYDKTLNKDVLFIAAEILVKQGLEEISAGHSLDLGDLGTFHIAFSDTIKGPHPKPKDFPEFEIRYTSSPAMKEALNKIEVDTISYAEKNPVIAKIFDNCSGEENKSVTPGNFCIIQGSLLKLNLNSDLDIVQFIMVNDDGSIKSDAKPVIVDKKCILKSTATRLEFMVPEGLAQGCKYIISITSTFLKAGLSRKTPITGYSDIITVN